MEANRSRSRWTYAEFARLPSEGSTRYEIIDDERVVTPAPTGAHQLVVSNLMRLLAPFAHDRARVLDRRHRGRAIEVWRLAEGAKEAEVSAATDLLRWTPVAGGPTLEVRVAEILPPA